MENCYEMFNLNYLPIVMEYSDEVYTTLNEVEPLMASVLQITVDSLYFHAKTFNKALMEHIESGNTEPFIKCNEEFYKEFMFIAANTDYACHRALQMCAENGLEII